MSEPRRRLSIVVPELPWLKQSVTAGPAKGEQSPEVQRWEQERISAMRRHLVQVEQDDAPAAAPRSRPPASQ